ncbi:MAG: autotransporter-associated beta strand repeat-containing protein, partial [Planctomycetota bacterium]
MRSLAVSIATAGFRAIPLWSITAMAIVGMAVATVQNPVRADVLAGWDFSTLTGGTGNWGPSPFAPTTTAANLTAVGLTRGPAVSQPPSGTSATAAARAWGGNTWWGGTAAPDSLDAAITRGAYITFGLTAAEGYTLSFSDVAPYNVRRSNSGPSLGQWQFQLGSGSFANIGTSIPWGTNTAGNPGNPQSTISLSSISALQNVPSGTPVTFRIVNYNTGTAGGAGGTWYLNEPTITAGVNDFIINGIVSGTGSSTNLFWNGGAGWATTISATGGNGTWNNGAGGWDPTKTATFGGTAGTVTLAAPSAASGLSFTTAGYTLTGGTLTLTGPSIDANAISVPSGATSITSVIAGGAGLTKTGAGSLSLGGANTFSGGLQLQTGTVAISSAAALGPTNDLQFTGGALAVAGSLDLGSRAIGGVSGSAGAATLVIPAGATLSSSGPMDLSSLTLPAT